MAFDKSDNGAHMAGYVDQFLADCPAHSMHISVKPLTDLDGCFTAFNHDDQEYVFMSDWLWTFEPIND